MNFGTHGHIYLAEKVEKWCYCGNTTILSEETTKMYTKKKEENILRTLLIETMIFYFKNKKTFCAGLH